RRWSDARFDKCANLLHSRRPHTVSPGEPTSNLLLLLVRADGAEWIRSGEARTDHSRGRVTGRVAETAGAHLLEGATIDEKVVDHIVGPPSHAAWNVIVVQSVTYFPGDDVIGAGSVAADTQSADQFLTGLLVERQATAEDIDSSDNLTDQRVV